MTDVLNGRSVTDGGDARMRVRVAPTPLNGVGEARAASGSAHARAIPADVDVRQDDQPSKVRNFVSSHGGEAKQAFLGSYPLTGRPSNLAEVARRVWPAKGQYRRAPVTWVAAVVVGVFRLAVTAGCFVLLLAVDGPKRAAVAFTFTLLTAAVFLIASALPS